MSLNLGAEIPAEIAVLLTGREEGPGADLAIPIITLDPAGRPHPALLSPREVIARSSSLLTLMLYGRSSTTGNVRRDGRVSLIVVEGPAAYYIKGRAAETSPPSGGVPGMAYFTMRVEEVLKDIEEDAPLTSAIRFRRRTPT